MITKEEFNMVHLLFKQGNSINEISKTTGLNKRTVIKRLKEDNLQMKKRTYPSLLDDFKPYIDKRVAGMLPRRISSTVMLPEIQNMWYKGRVRILRDYIALTYGKNNLIKEEPLIRFETAPWRSDANRLDYRKKRKGSDSLFLIRFRLFQIFLYIFHR